MHQIEIRLSSLVNSIKELKQKCETHEHKEVFDASFRENLAKSIETIELVKSKAMIEEMGVKQMEEDFNKIAKDYERKINEESLKLKEKQLELERKEEQTKKFYTELKTYEVKFNELIKSLMQFLSSLNAKIESIKSLSNTSDLLNQAKYLFDSIEANVKEIDFLTEEKIRKNAENDESAFSRVLNDLNANLTKYAKNKEKLEAKLAVLDQFVKESVEADLKEKLRQRQMAEEAQKTKEAADMKQKEKELQEAQEREAAKKVQDTKVAEQKRFVQNIFDTDKNGINQLTLKKYESILKSFDKIRTDADAALSSNDLKLYKFDLQKAINFPLNSLLEDETNEENRRNFNEKIKTLLRLLSGQTCDITTSLRVAPSKHPKSIDFCLVYLARKLTEKGEETVATRPETAFQYVQVIMQVFKQVKEFEPMLMAQFYEKCPFTVPYYKPRLPGQKDDQYFE